MSSPSEADASPLSTEERARIRDGIGDAIEGAIPKLGSALDEDPTQFLRLVAATQVATEASRELLEQAVVGARHAGLSWEAVGNVMGVTRQAAQQRFRAAVPGEAKAGLAEERRVLTGVHAFTELAVLEVEGRRGYHLVDFGALHLVVEPSGHQWEHRRLTLPRAEVRDRMEQDGWRPVGDWFPFSYYKRPLSDPAER